MAPCRRSVLDVWRRDRPAEEPRREVPDRWRPIILECDRLVAELDRLAASSPAGALRDRLEIVRSSAAASVEDAVAAAQRAGEVQRLAGTLDVAGITAAYKQARRDADAAATRGRVPDGLAASVASLQRQHASAHRLLNAVDETEGRLQAVRARLTEIVLSAGEMALGTSPAGTRPADEQVATLAAEVRLLRDAFDELG